MESSRPLRGLRLAHPVGLKSVWRPSTVGVVNLVAATTEDLLVTIELWAWDARGRFIPLHLFTTGVTDGATLSAQLDPPAQEVVKLRIVATETTSPIGWREIEALEP